MPHLVIILAVTFHRPRPWGAEEAELYSGRRTKWRKGERADAKRQFNEL